MEETKIWSIGDNDTSATQLDPANQMKTEERLEDILTTNPEMLEEGLQLVGRQTSTSGGPLDLLGVDRNGKLVVYELKRGTLNREAVAQVIDYASALDAMDTASLYAHIAERSGNLGIPPIDDFETWYGELRVNSGLSEEDPHSLMPPRMVLVGLGADDTTERMVNYMASIRMDISLLTFHGFKHDGKMLLARNLEVDSSNVTPKDSPSSRNLKEQFEKRTQTLSDDMRTLLSELEDMLRTQLRGNVVAHSGRRINFRLRYSGSGGRLSYLATLFIEIDEDNDCLKVGFHPIAIHLTRDEFKRIEESEFPFQSDPARNAPHYNGINYEVKFPICSIEQWNTHKDQLIELTQAVYEAYQKTQSS